MSRPETATRTPSTRPSSKTSGVLRTRLANVKPFPAVVARVRAVASDPRRTVADVAEVVERDVAFATRMLRLANSASSGLAQRCTSVRHAVALLGMRRIAAVAMNAGALDLIETSATAAPAVAHHAVATAGVARMLASFAGVSPDEAFTAGLLHDVGMLLILQTRDPLYEELIEQLGPNEEPSAAEEQSLLGFDHAQLGAEAVLSWSLPAPLPQIVAHHHDWPTAESIGGSVAATIALIRIADVLVPRLEARTEPNEEDLAALRQEPAVAYLGLPPEELVRMWASLRRASGPDGALEPVAGPAENAAPSAHDAPPPSARQPAERPARPPEQAPDRRAWVAAGAVVAAAAAAAAFWTLA